MKKPLTLFVLLLSISLPTVTYGGPAPIKKAASSCKRMLGKNTPTRAQILAPAQLEKTLHKRVQKSYKKIYNTLPMALMAEYLYAGEMPAVMVNTWPEGLSAGVYEEAPWLRAASPKAQQNYFMALHNRLVAQVSRQRLQLRQDIQTRLPRFVQGRVKFPGGARSRAWQAAQQISPQVKQILIGEQHLLKEGSQEILEFIKVVKAQNPHRQIVFLTEFMPQGLQADYWLSVLKQYAKDKSYYDIFNWVHQAGIPIIGLEPVYVWQNSAASLYTGALFQQKPHEVTLWESLGGLYLRNLAWKKVIEASRRKYPDALFIIYAGAGHTAYNAPYSIGKAFPQDETFVLNVVKNHSTLFNVFSDGLFETEPLLGWREKDLACLAGFDVRILIQ